MIKLTTRFFAIPLLCMATTTTVFAAQASEWIDQSELVDYQQNELWTTKLKEGKYGRVCSAINETRGYVTVYAHYRGDQLWRFRDSLSIDVDRSQQYLFLSDVGHWAEKRDFRDFNPVLEFSDAVLDAYGKKGS